jgi:hypothetical protein
MLDSSSRKERSKYNDSNKKTNTVQDPKYNFSIDRPQGIEDRSNSSKPSLIFCSICNTSDNIVTDLGSGEIICGSCGMVISDKIEDTSHLERRIFTQGGGEQMNETRARTGAPTSLARHDMGLATMIGRSNKDVILTFL